MAHGLMEEAPCAAAPECVVPTEELDDIMDTLAQGVPVIDTGSPVPRALAGQLLSAALSG